MRSPFSPALIATLLGAPARCRVWHSVIPRAMPPLTSGPEVGSSCCRPGPGPADTDVAAGIGEPARSPATEPTARSAGGGGSLVDGEASAGCAAVLADPAQLPSALTMSSAFAGPSRLRFIFPVLGWAQAGLVKAGCENQPPSFLSSNIREFVQPAEPRAAAHASAIVRLTRWRGKTDVPRPTVCLSPNPHFAS